MTTELWQQSAADLAAAIRGKEVECYGGAGGPFIPHRYYQPQNQRDCHIERGYRP